MHYCPIGWPACTRYLRRGASIGVPRQSPSAPLHFIPLHSLPMIEVLVNDRLGKRVRVKCLADDSVGDFKKVLAAQLGMLPAKIALQKGGSVLKDHISLGDYEVHDGTNLELYYS